MTARFLKLITVWAICSWPLGAGSVWAADYALTDPRTGSLRGDYNDIVINLQPGDVVSFPPDRRTFKLGPRLNQRDSGMTAVFELADSPQRVLRIPRRAAKAYFIDETRRGALALESAGVPIVRLHEFSSHRFAVVDRAQIDVMLNDFLRMLHAEPSPWEQRLLDELVEFARKTALFQKIGDMRADQIAYDAKRGWILLDWTTDHAEVDLPTDLNVSGKNSAFGKILPEPEGHFKKTQRALSARIQAAIKSERTRVMTEISALAENDPVDYVRRLLQFNPRSPEAIRTIRAQPQVFKESVEFQKFVLGKWGDQKWASVLTLIEAGYDGPVRDLVDKEFQFFWHQGGALGRDANRAIASLPEWPPATRQFLTTRLRAPRLDFREPIQFAEVLSGTKPWPPEFWPEYLRWIQQPEIKDREVLPWITAVQNQTHRPPEFEALLSRWEASGQSNKIGWARLARGLPAAPPTGIWQTLMGCIQNRLGAAAR